MDTEIEVTEEEILAQKQRAGDIWFAQSKALDGGEQIKLIAIALAQAERRGAYKMNKLIGLIGLKGSGKSTVADMLGDQIFIKQQTGYCRESMARILKDMLRVLGLDDQQVNGNAKELPSTILGGKTPRWAMQSLGTEWGRDCIDKNLWVNAMENKLRLYWKVNPHSKFVIDDIRFENEAEMVKRLGGTLWAIFRPGNGFDTSHPSESTVLKLAYDKEIQNTGTIDDLKKQVLGAL